jgi:hypothetical protein
VAAAAAAAAPPSVDAAAAARLSLAAFLAALAAFFRAFMRFLASSTRVRSVSMFLDKNRRYIGKSQSKRPPKRTQRTPHLCRLRPGK